MLFSVSPCRARIKLTCLRDAAPLLDLDRDERKLEAFLHLHKHDLLVADLRIFLPFTINLDPYLRKVLKGTMAGIAPPRHFLLISNIFPCPFAEDQQALEDEGIVIPMKSGLPSPPHRPFQHPMSIPPTMSYSPQFGQHSASSYQPYFMQPPPQQQLLAVTSMNAPSFPEPAVGPTAPQQRKKSIIESIVPVAVDNTKSMPEYMNAFPVNRRSSRSCMYIVCEANLCLCLYLYFVGGSAACSPIQTVR